MGMKEERRTINQRGKESIGNNESKRIEKKIEKQRERNGKKKKNGENNR